MTENLVSQQLVKEYMEMCAGIEAANEAYRMERVHQAVPAFEENCRVWLGDLWEEFHPEDIELKWDSGEYHYYWMNLPVTWEGIEGHIYSGDCSNNYRGGTPRQPDLVFFIEDGRGQKRQFNLDLPAAHPAKAQKLDYAYQASGMPDPLKLGKFLFEALNERNIAQKAAEEYKQSHRNNMLNQWINGFYSNNLNTEDQVKARLARALEAFPEEESRLRKAAADRLSQLEAEAKATAEFEARQLAIDAEKERLIAQATASFRPVTFYRVEYAGRVRDEEGSEIGLFSVYTTSPTPEADGWYREIYHGEIKKVLIPNVAKVEEIHAADLSQVPHEMTVGNVLNSESFEYVSEYVHTLPDNILDLIGDRKAVEDGSGAVVRPTGE